MSRQIVREKVEPEPTLSAVPMRTTDGMEIKLNMILYRVSWSSGYNFNKEGQGEVEALRVFHVNNSARVFRVRCIQGCESIFKIADGCTTSRLYGKVTHAVSALRKQIQEDMKACSKKIDKIQKTLNHINSEDVRVSYLGVGDMKLPKEIRI